MFELLGLSALLGIFVLPFAAGVWVGRRSPAALPSQPPHDLPALTRRQRLEIVAAETGPWMPPALAQELAHLRGQSPFAGPPPDPARAPEAAPESQIKDNEGRSPAIDVDLGEAIDGGVLPLREPVTAGTKSPALSLEGGFFAVACLLVLAGSIYLAASTWSAVPSQWQTLYARVVLLGHALLFVATARLVGARLHLLAPARALVAVAWALVVVASSLPAGEHESWLGWSLALLASAATTWATLAWAGREVGWVATGAARIWLQVSVLGLACMAAMGARWPLLVHHVVAVLSVWAAGEGWRRVSPQAATWLVWQAMAWIGGLILLAAGASEAKIAAADLSGLLAALSWLGCWTLWPSLSHVVIFSAATLGLVSGLAQQQSASFAGALMVVVAVSQAHRVRPALRRAGLVWFAGLLLAGWAGSWLMLVGTRDAVVSLVGLPPQLWTPGGVFDVALVVAPAPIFGALLTQGFLPTWSASQVAMRWVNVGLQLVAIGLVLDQLEDSPAWAAGVAGLHVLLSPCWLAAERRWLSWWAFDLWLMVGLVAAALALDVSRAGVVLLLTAVPILGIVLHRRVGLAVALLAWLAAAGFAIELEDRPLFWILLWASSGATAAAVLLWQGRRTRDPWLLLAVLPTGWAAAWVLCFGGTPAWLDPRWQMSVAAIYSAVWLAAHVWRPLPKWWAAELALFAGVGWVIACRHLPGAAADWRSPTVEAGAATLFALVHAVTCMVVRRSNRAAVYGWSVCPWGVALPWMLAPSHPLVLWPSGLLLVLALVGAYRSRASQSVAQATLAWITVWAAGQIAVVLAAIRWGHGGPPLGICAPLALATLLAAWVDLAVAPRLSFWSSARGWQAARLLLMLALLQVSMVTWSLAAVSAELLALVCFAWLGVAGVALTLAIVAKNGALIYLAEGAVVALVTVLREHTLWGQRLAEYQAFGVMVAALLLLATARFLALCRVNFGVEQTEKSAALLPLALPLLLRLDGHVGDALAALLSTGFYMYLAHRRRATIYVWLAAAGLNLWLAPALLARDVGHTLAIGLPLGLSLLVLDRLHPGHDDASAKLMRTLGLVVLCGACSAHSMNFATIGMALAFAGQSALLILAGIHWHLRSYVYVGLGFFGSTVVVNLTRFGLQDRFFAGVAGLLAGMVLFASGLWLAKNKAKVQATRQAIARWSW